MIAWILISLFIPLRVGEPIRIVLISGILSIQVFTLSEIAIPPAGAYFSIRLVILTSSPYMSSSNTIISPKWIEIRNSKFLVLRIAFCISIQQYTDEWTESKVRSSPSPISFTHEPL